VPSKQLRFFPRVRLQPVDKRLSAPALRHGLFQAKPHLFRQLLHLRRGIFFLNRLLFGNQLISPLNQNRQNLLISTRLYTKKRAREYRK